MVRTFSMKKIIPIIVLGIFAFLCSILLVGCTDGTDGKDGADGAKWITGIDAPTSSIGNDGDMYVDMDDYILYQKVSGNWVIIMRNFGKGEDGTDGVDGTDGTDGLDGATWLYGQGAPTESDGNTGDFYLDTDTCDVYFKTQTGWTGPITTLKGEAGQDGEDGETPTLSFDEDGYLVINGTQTDLKKVVVDANLETAGQAADAAAVGEKLAEILELINTSSIDVERLSSYINETIYNKTNLIDDGTEWKEDYYINATGGGILPYGGNSGVYYATNTYIPVEAEKNYVLFLNSGDSQTALTIYHYAFYDSNKSYIIGSTTGIKKITSPENAAYVRFTLKIESGSSTPTYDEVINGLASLEFYNQNTTTYSAPTAVMSLQGIDASETLIAGSVTAELCDFFDVYDSPNLIQTDSVIEGYYCYPNSDGSLYTNTNYVALQAIPVTPGKIVNVYTSTGKLINMRYIVCFTSSYAVVSGTTGDRSGYNSNVTSFTIPDDCYYVTISIKLDDWQNYDIMVQCTDSGDYIGTYYEPGIKIYMLNSSYYEAITTTTPYVYLPSELCVAEGVTVELYNEQICINVDNWHVQWKPSGSFGTVTERKISITCTSALVGTTGTLSFKLYDDDLTNVYSATCTVKFVAADIEADQLLIPIGDSLTNSKPWLERIYSTLSNGTIKFRGTQGTTSKSAETYTAHEGRSGAGTGWYNSGSSTYGFNTTDTTLTRQTDDDGATYYTTNPFWNPDTDAFDFDYYCNSTSDGGAGYFEDTEGNEISITPTGVVIFLGTNGISLDSSTAVTNISTLIANIQKSTKGANIPIYVVNTLFRPTQIFSETTDGYSTNSSGEYSYQADMKVLNLEIGLYDALSSTSNVFFVPVAATLDRVWSFPYEWVQVNPYVEEYELRYTDCVHPSTAGYYQIADIMFSTIAAHYSDYT